MNTHRVGCKVPPSPGTLPAPSAGWSIGAPGEMQAQLPSLLLPPGDVWGEVCSWSNPAAATSGAFGFWHFPHSMLGNVPVRSDALTSLPMLSSASRTRASFPVAL